MKEKMKVNKSLLIGWAVLVVVLLLAYTVEFININLLYCIYTIRYCSFYCNILAL